MGAYRWQGGTREALSSISGERAQALPFAIQYLSGHTIRWPLLSSNAIRTIVHFNP
jgi:hypothetical protein